MKVVFRHTKVIATELQSDLSLKETEIILGQGVVQEVLHIHPIDANLSNIVVNDQLTYWNVPISQFEIIGDQGRTQAVGCCG